MPNYCSFSLKAVGKKENLEKLQEYLKQDYDYNDKKNYPTGKHFFRVFEVYTNESITAIDEDKDIHEMIVDGECAWSVFSCMFSGNATYYNDLKSRIPPEDFKGITIPMAAKELNLKIEIFSEEPGWGFMEHYLIDNDGQVLIDDCRDYEEQYDEETGETRAIGGIECVFTI